MFRISNKLELFLNLSKVQTELTRRLDSFLNGLSLTEFTILYHLNQAKDQKLRRIDLAEKVALTPSGITRLLLPMEKIGLVKKEINPRDARSSFVLLAPGGKEKLKEGIERAELFCEERFSLKPKDIKTLKGFLDALGVNR